MVKAIWQAVPVVKRTPTKVYPILGDFHMRLRIIGVIMKNCISIAIYQDTFMQSPIPELMQSKMNKNIVTIQCFIFYIIYLYIFYIIIFFVTGQILT